MVKERVLSGLQSLKVFGSSLPSWGRKNFIWALLIIPVLHVVLMYYISVNDIFGWQNSRVCKADLEIIHPSFIAIAVFLAFAGWLWQRDLAIGCIGFLCCGALSREILGQGHTFIFVIAILIVIVVTEQNRERMATFLKSRLATSLLSMAFICYIASQLLDRGLIKRIGWLIMWDTSWDVPYTSNIEESLEALGGLFLIFTIISLIVMARKRSRLSGRFLTRSS